MPHYFNKWEAQSVHLQSDQLLFRCLDEHASWNRKYGCKNQDKGSLIGSSLWNNSLISILILRDYWFETMRDGHKHLLIYLDNVWVFI